VRRSGSGTVPGTGRGSGVGSRTVEPMVVNLDTGFGLAYTGTVGDGQELRFESDGRATLDGAGVARLSYTFTGGVFADAAGAHRLDFVFEGGLDPGRTAPFPVAPPVDRRFRPG